MEDRYSYCLELAEPLQRILRAISGITNQLPSELNNPVFQPLIRHKVFLLEDALRIFRFVWSGRPEWELNTEDGLAIYKWSVIYRAFRLTPKAYETFSKSQWAKHYSAPDEVFKEIMPETMEAIIEELQPWLESIPEFESVKIAAMQALSEVTERSGSADQISLQSPNP